MQTLDSTPLDSLSRQVDLVKTSLAIPQIVTLPDPKPIPLPIKIPIPTPATGPVTTAIVRGTTTIGYVITAGGDPVPTSAAVALTSGTLWFEASLLGTAFASVAGFVGIPFSRASLKATGTVTFASGSITLDAAATLAFTVASAITPTTGPAGDPVGADFLSAKLTPFTGAVVTLAPTATTIVLTGSAAATIYGQALSLSPAASPTLGPLNLFSVPYVVVECGIAQTSFTVSSSASPEIVIGGTAKVSGAGAVFPVIDLAPASLTPPADAWGIAVVAGDGLSAKIAPLTAPLPLAGSVFVITPDRLLGLVGIGAGRARESYLLWNTPPSASPAPPTQPPQALPTSQITFDLAQGSLIAFSSTPDEESTSAAGTLNAIADRPTNADGQRINLQGPALLTRIHTAASISVDIGSTLTPTAVTSLALVAENALIPVGTPNGLLIYGKLTNNQINGGLVIGFPPVSIIPTFPDPYAAAYVDTAANERITAVAAAVTWSATTAPVLTIALVQTDLSATGATTIDEDNVVGFRLLDVSSNADQWGITLSRFADFSFTGLQMQAPAAGTTVFTVPGISWEPVVDATSAPAWLAASSPDDGIPTTFLVASTTPAPIVPVLALEQYQAAAATQATYAGFTLPFGITATMSVPTPGSSGPAYTIPDVEFPADGLTGARVLTITGPSGTLPGTAYCGFGETPPAYGAQVLGTALPSVASFWDQDFGPGGKEGFIPVGRIDLSGYGTTLFSDWRDPSTTDVGIVRALFNVLIGRTAHEIITAQTWILPWCIRLQRTITFDRSDGGEVVKHDTGWQAVSVGEFELLTGPPSLVLPGPVAGLGNVRNIQFSTATVSNGGKTYTPCTFDADVAFASPIVIAANGKNPAATAFGSGIQGYADDTVSTASNLNPAIPASDIISLMQQVGRVTGSAGFIARVGGSGAEQFTMTASSFGAAVAAGSTPMLQTAIFGTPILPKDGQWSVSRRAATATVPQAVDPATPVPLTQGTSSGTTPPTSPGTFAATSYRLLDPEDAQSVNSPATIYGIMQGTGTSKTLFEHPLINSAGTGLGFNNKPQLADVGALLGIASIFPDISSALQIVTTDGLAIAGDGFTKTYTWGPSSTPPSPAPPDRHLLDIAIVHLSLVYGAQDPDGNPLDFQGTLTLDASTNPTSWSLSLMNLSFVAAVDGFGTLLTVCGGFQAGSTTTPGFVGLPGVSPPGLQVYYGEALGPVKDILTGLSGLASALGGSANLDVGFSGNTLSVQQGFTLPTIPLGFGEITNIGLNLGFSATIPSDLAFSVGIGSTQDPFQWVVSPLAGTGAIVLGVQGGGLNVYIEAGIGLGLSLSVAVASGSASIVVSVSLNIGTTDVEIALALTGNAQVDVLGGLASASLTLSAAIMITIEEALKEAILAAQVSVGIHISICWVISVSFDGSWSFSETVSI